MSSATGHRTERIVRRKRINRNLTDFFENSHKVPIFFNGKFIFCFRAYRYTVFRPVDKTAILIGCSSHRCCVADLNLTSTADRT